MFISSRYSRIYKLEENMMQENLKNKYDITSEELKRAIDQINLGKIACDGIVLVALVDLLLNGDIASSEKSE